MNTLPSYSEDRKYGKSQTIIRIRTFILTSVGLLPLGFINSEKNWRLKLYAIQSEKDNDLKSYIKHQSKAFINFIFNIYVERKKWWMFFVRKDLCP